MPTRGGTVVEIKRQKPVVAAYHYDQPNAEQNVETQLQVGFTPLNTDDQTYPKENSIIRCILDFRLVFEEPLIFKQKLRRRKCLQKIFKLCYM